MHTYVYIYAYIYTQLCIHIYMYVCRYVCICVYICNLHQLLTVVQLNFLTQIFLYIASCCENQLKTTYHDQSMSRNIIISEFIFSLASHLPNQIGIIVTTHHARPCNMYVVWLIMQLNTTRILFVNSLYSQVCIYILIHDPLTYYK